MASIPAPGHGGDSGLAWAEGSLWVGQYRDRKIHQIDPETGAILRTIESNRFVTGVTWVDGELWHGTWEGDESDIRRIDPDSGAVLERLEMPRGTGVSGLESDGADLFYCGGGPSGKVRAVRRPKRREMMTDHKTGTREEWLAARLELLEAEKELTRRSDELARRRQELPWVRIDKEYRFETDEGSASLATSSEGARSSSSTTSCSGPTTRRGVRPARRSRTGSTASSSTWPTTTSRSAAVSRAPLAKLQAYKRRMGWTFPWASSFGSDFNFDFNVCVHRGATARGRLEYNYRREAARWPRRMQSREGPVAEFAAMAGTDVATYTRERPGMSAFALEDGVVYHTYSTYARGLDGLWGMYQWLDRAPKGRNETGVWWRRHDEYDKR